jgi:hypothetical protein
MNHLHLLIPDLFPPQDIAAEVCADLPLPALARLLARAERSDGPALGLEEALCQWYGVQAVAPVRAAADGLEVATGYWWCADPVNLQLHRSQMVLMPEVGVTREEATALCAALNEHFAQAGMQFFAPHPQRWYLRLAAAPQLSTEPLRQVAWQDARLHQPQGADALHWQRVMTELQMVLYGHPLNQAREARHEALISSLWLWGGGVAEPLSKPFESCGGDSVLPAAFAKAGGVVWADTPEVLLEGNKANGLWVCEAPAIARQRGDFAAWRTAVQQVEADCARVWSALRAGRLRKVTLRVTGETGMQIFELTRASAWRFWRGKKSLAEYAV